MRLHISLGRRAKESDEKEAGLGQDTDLASKVKATLEDARAVLRQSLTPGPTRAGGLSRAGSVGVFSRAGSLGAATLSRAGSVGVNSRGNSVGVGLDSRAASVEARKSAALEQFLKRQAAAQARNLARRTASAEAATPIPGAATSPNFKSGSGLPEILVQQNHIKATGLNRETASRVAEGLGQEGDDLTQQHNLNRSDRIALSAPTMMSADETRRTQKEAVDGKFRIPACV